MKRKRRTKPTSPHGHQSLQAHFNFLPASHRITTKRTQIHVKLALLVDCMSSLQPQCTGSLLINELHVTSLLWPNCMRFFKRTTHDHGPIGALNEGAWSSKKTAAAAWGGDIILDSFSYFFSLVFSLGEIFPSFSFCNFLAMIC